MAMVLVIIIGLITGVLVGFLRARNEVTKKGPNSADIIGKRFTFDGIGDVMFEPVVVFGPVF